MITGLINVFPVVKESVFTGAMISKCVKMSSVVRDLVTRVEYE